MICNDADLERIEMVTGELKNKIDSLWEIFWTGGLTNDISDVHQGFG